MKRSEALNLIWEAINELEDADHILKRLEEAGMLPPCQGEQTLRTLDGTYVGKQVVFAWEAEDA